MVESQPPHGVIYTNDDGLVKALVGEASASFPRCVYANPEESAIKWCHHMGAKTTEVIKS